MEKISIFRKLAEEKRYIKNHLKNGGKLSDLKDKFKFVMPIKIKKDEGQN